MDSPMSDANKQIIISGVSSKSHEEQGSTSIDQGESSESAAPAADEPPPPPPGGGAGNYQLAIVDHDREYGCRYCHKKFSNKQALGGHQNAHKVERATEKNEQETAAIGYYGGGPNSYPARINVPAPFLNSCPRPHDFLHRSLFSWSCSDRAVPYNSRPAAEPYAPCPAAAVYSGWSAPRAPSFAARPHFTLPAPNMNIRLPNFGAGSSRAFGPVSNHEGPSGFPALPIRPGGNNRPVGPVNLRNIPGDQHDESGLDLSLKLG